MMILDVLGMNKAILTTHQKLFLLISYIRIYYSVSNNNNDNNKSERIIYVTYDKSTWQNSSWKNSGSATGYLK